MRCPEIGRTSLRVRFESGTGLSEAWPMGRCGVPMIGAEWLPAAG
jgi:hypothetical protein